MSERPRFRINEPSYVGHALVGAGKEVFYTPPEGSLIGANLSPLNDEAQALVDEQGEDHPDKTAHQGKVRKAAAAAAAAAAELEAETPNGVVKSGPKGDTRTKPALKPAAKPKAGAKGAAPAQEAAEEPDVAEDEPDEGDVA